MYLESLLHFLANSTSNLSFSRSQQLLRCLHCQSHYRLLSMDGFLQLELWFQNITDFFFVCHPVEIFGLYTNCMFLGTYGNHGSPFFSIFAYNGFSLQETTIAFERNLLFLLPFLICDIRASKLFVSLASLSEIPTPYNFPLPNF